MVPTIVDGDLLKQDVDVIVNSWNRNFIPWWLLVPQGVSGAIKKSGGYAPFIEVRRFGMISTGSAVLTTAGRLPYQAIIHVASINAFWTATEQSISRSVIEALKIAEQKGFRSIAFPVLGAGTGRFKEAGALKIMENTLASIDCAVEVRIVRFRK
jgi:O-acetyl-ADP-ribose deacetylase